MFSQGIGYQNVYLNGFAPKRVTKFVNSLLVNVDTGFYDIVDSDKDKLLVNVDSTEMMLFSNSVQFNDCLEIVALVGSMVLTLEDGCQVYTNGEEITNTTINILKGQKAIFFKIGSEKYILTFEPADSNSYKPLSATYVIQCDGTGNVNVTEKYAGVGRPDFSIQLKNVVLDNFPYPITNGIIVLPSNPFNPITGDGCIVNHDINAGEVTISLYSHNSQVNLATAIAEFNISMLVW